VKRSPTQPVDLVDVLDEPVVVTTVAQSSGDDERDRRIPEGPVQKLSERGRKTGLRTPADVSNIRTGRAYP
jgi:hypothetical protein